MGSLMLLWSDHQSRGLTSDVGWLLRGSRRQGHGSLIIKLESLGLLTWWCCGEPQDQPEKASSSVQALLKSLFCRLLLSLHRKQVIWPSPHQSECVHQTEPRASGLSWIMLLSPLKTEKLGKKKPKTRKISIRESRNFTVQIQGAWPALYNAKALQCSIAKDEGISFQILLVGGWGL